YDDFPALALLSASYRNASQKALALDSVSLQKHVLNATLADSNTKSHDMWTFSGSSMQWGLDETFPVPAKFRRQNPFGAPVGTGDDPGSAGGGIPVLAFWTRNAGLAIGHLETLPLTLSMPVKTTGEGRVEASVDVAANATLQPGESFSTPRTFAMVFHGDFFEPLRMWSGAVEREGLAQPKNNDENYAISWCGW